MYTPTHDGGNDPGRWHPELIALDGREPLASKQAGPPVAAALHLFLHAAFSAYEPALLGSTVRETAAQFGVGAIVQASALAGLPDREARGLTRALLRWSFGMGHLRAWQWERALRQQALTQRGRVARHEGCLSLLGWLRGEDPARRLDRLLMRAGAAQPAAGCARPAPVRELTARPH